MLTTSIAWGNFKCDNRIEFPGIQKNPVYGNGYLKAYLDNEMGTPKLRPGECRIVLDKMPNIPPNYCMEKSKKHFQYFWNVDTKDEIDAFKKKCNDNYSRIYAGMLNALRHS